MAAAQAAGFTGKAVKVAILDTAASEDYQPLAGRISAYNDFTAKPADSTQAGKSGHGALMAALIGGREVEGFQGGAAPDALLHVGRVCAEDSCASDAITKGVAHYVASNVRLFNLSLGSPGSSTTAAAYAPMAEYIVSGDALLVAATGNAGRHQPDNPAALPVYLPQYRHNWLAVANVRINSSGQAAGLHAVSNACGDAAAFCLVAPGLHQVAPVSGTAFDATTHIDGTSASTAVVTGAAAQVWQAFPWMSAHNVQQTLLTTATDLGAAGVDELYGWGMLNAGKAVNGPARFTQDFTAELRSGESGTFSNAIDGAGGLIKRGNGVLTLRADNSYSGRTLVDAGALALAGNIAGDLHLANQAQLLADGGSIGGNFTADTATTTVISLGMPLLITGQAQLAGKLHLRPEQASYTVNSTETLLRADAVHGTFSSVTYANDLFWQASLHYAAQGVTASMQRTSVSASAQLMAAPAAVLNGASQADALLGTSAPGMKGPATAPAPIHLATASLLLADNTLASTSLATLSAPLLGMEHHISLDHDLRQMAHVADRQPDSSQAAPLVFANGIHHQGELTQPGYGRGSWRMHGFQGGLHGALGDTDQQWGIGLSAVDMTLRAPLADTGEADYLRGHVWWQGRWPQWQFSAQAGLGSSRIQSRRLLIAGDLQESVISRRRDHATHLRVDAGWTLHPWVHPYLAAGVVRRHQGRFDERSAMGLGLRAGAQSMTLPFAETGVRADGGSGRWQWRGTLAYQRLLGDRDLAYRASFDGADGIVFDVAGMGLAQERWRLHLQGRWQLADHLHLQTGVHGEWQASGRPQQGVEIGLEWRF